MKRRNFIRNIAAITGGAPFVINGLPTKVLGNNQYLTKSLSDSLQDNILILIDLNGGNDGLNTLVPIDQYSLYQGLRTDLAIPESGNRKFMNLDTTLSLADQVGIHPDMTNFKAMYENGLVNIVQGVGYENTNGSHFRSRDIWFMGGSYNEVKNSGWMGRYLDYEYPNYPEAYPNENMPDPLGLEIGTKVSLGYHRSQGIPTALALNDPSNISNLVSYLGGVNPENIPSNRYGSELQFIMDVYANTNDYAQNIQDRYDNGSNHVNYPGGNNMQYPFACPPQFVNNRLGPQLQTVARLINGGCKTKIYMVSIGGFDTHDSQVQNNNSTYGVHGALLYHFSNAVKVFFDDLKISGKDENVIAMSFTDFGRRPFSNGSYGTDHGTSSPTFVFGKHVNPGVIGTNPSLSVFDNTGNLLIQNDYRQILTSVLCDWMGADNGALTATHFEDYTDQKLDIIKKENDINSIRRQRNNHFEVGVYPNPVEEILHLNIGMAASAPVELKVYDFSGKLIIKEQHHLSADENKIHIQAGYLSSGFYTVQVTNTQNNISVGRKFLKK